jgi:hypothetical protein
MMSMPQNTNSLINSLVDDLKPVSPMKPRAGLLRTGLAAMVTLIAVTLTTGMRTDLVAGHFDPVYVLSSGALLILSFAATYGAIQLSQPYVGNQQTGWQWASAMAALLPATAVLTLGLSWMQDGSFPIDSTGWTCMAAGLLFGLLLAATLTVWLRRGAPTSPHRAGLLTGIAAGALGSFAYSLHCPHNDLVHIGIWHGLSVVASALVGWLAVPRLIRW